MFKISLVFFLLMAIAPVHAADPEDVQTRIFNYFLKRANEGDMNSQFVVGSRYETGVGVPKDEVRAYEWFAKSAAQGHPLAMQKMEDHLHPAGAVENTHTEKNVEKKESAPPRMHETHATTHAPAKPSSSPRATVTAPVAVVVPRPPAPSPATVTHTPAAKVAISATKAPEPIAPVQIAAKAPPEPAVNAMDIIMKGVWRRGPSPAEYLPSVKTSCLQSGTDEVVCFSQELQRAVGNSLLTYTVKATLTNFSKDGSFDIDYLYNVTDIGKADKPAPSQDKDGAADIAVKLGWQEPARRLDCKANSDKALTCIKDKRYSLHFAK